MGQAASRSSGRPTGRRIRAGRIMLMLCDEGAGKGQAGAPRSARRARPRERRSGAWNDRLPAPPVPRGPKEAGWKKGGGPKPGRGGSSGPAAFRRSSCSGASLPRSVSTARGQLEGVLALLGDAARHHGQDWVSASIGSPLRVWRRRDGRADHGLQRVGIGAPGVELVGIDADEGLDRAQTRGEHERAGRRSAAGKAGHFPVQAAPANPGIAPSGGPRRSSDCRPDPPPNLGRRSPCRRSPCRPRRARR